MTKDKQIIIDGVDVSGCESFCNGICCKVGFGDDASCKLFSDCNHKQLKRAEKTMQEIWDRLGKTTDNLMSKEQECEELKKIIDEAKNSKLDLKSFLVGEAIQNEYEQQLDQLKAENDELKKIIERLDVPKHEVIDMDIALENEKLKAVLTEIKEIVGIGLVDGLQPEEYSGFLKILQAQILQKISECEVGNEV